MNNTSASNTTTAEQKGAYFLQWVAYNEREMKKALKKNCTFDPDIFDDVFNEAIINVHSTIVKNDREIANIKNYFFLALKWLYQARQGQHRKHRDSAVRDYWNYLNQPEERIDKEAKEADTSEAMEMMRAALVEEYGEEWTEIFLDYWAGRASNSTSYRHIIESYGLHGNVKEQLQQMRTFVIDECRYVKKLYHTDYATNS